MSRAGRMALPLLLGTAVAAALAGDSPALPEALRLPSGEHRKAHVEISLKAAFSSKEHKVRSLTDEATIDARLDLAFGERRKEGVPVEASFESLSVHRRARAKIAGFFSDDERDDRGDASWKKGESDAPPPWKVLVTPRGLALADTSPVTSAWGRWVGEAWLDRRDARSGEDAKLRRLARYTELGTLLAAPELPEKDAVGTTFPFQLGESSLTNAFIDLRLTYSLGVTCGRAGEYTVSGPLSKVELVHGRPCDEKRIDQWLDLAFKRGGPKATGELEARFVSEHGCWSEVSSSVSLVYEGAFEGGSGRASFERKITVKAE